MAATSFEPDMELTSLQPIPIGFITAGVHDVLMLVLIGECAAEELQGTLSSQISNGRPHLAD